jgi:hypothetical protein
MVEMVAQVHLHQFLVLPQHMLAVEVDQDKVVVEPLEVQMLELDLEAQMEVMLEQILVVVEVVDKIKQLLLKEAMVAQAS